MATLSRIALIQLKPKSLDPEDNYVRSAAFIKSAAEQGAKLAILPEYHLTGWEPDNPNFISSCANWADFLARYQQLARTLDISIVPGTIIEAHTAGKDDGNDNAERETILYNVAYFLAAGTGEILNRYVKKNLWHPERPHLTGSATSERHIAFDTPLGVKAGMLICWDLAFPEAFRELVGGGGAQLIIIPTFWTLNDCSAYARSKNPRCEALFLETTLTARAFENTCAVAFVNIATGSQKSAQAQELSSKEADAEAGLSRVTLPIIGVVPPTATNPAFENTSTHDNSNEGMSIVDIDWEIIRQAEEVYRVRADMGRHDWHYSYSHS